MSLVFGFEQVFVSVVDVVEVDGDGDGDWEVDEVSLFNGIQQVLPATDGNENGKLQGDSASASAAVDGALVRESVGLALRRLLLSKYYGYYCAPSEASAPVALSRLYRLLDVSVWCMGATYTADDVGKDNRPWMQYTSLLRWIG